MAEETKGFLGRWARRKTDVLQGKPVGDPGPVAARAPTGVAGAAAPVPAREESSSAVSPPVSVAAVPAEKGLSLEDVKLLTKDSDFKPFMTADVGPEVRNAAMKKLFADPHFNVMDGLDTYIDDYSLSDPIPESMLRQMASAKFLKLFDDDEDSDKPKDIASSPRENANNPTGETVAQSDESREPASPDTINSEQPPQTGPLTGSCASQEDHAHTDLRLQPDHATPASDAGRGT